jgi:NADPH:quinone reductase-like Zn-dependent oxidoreductase
MVGRARYGVFCSQSARHKKLQGKVAVITGGTTGIVLAAAKLFVREGAYVFITGRRQKELDAAVKAIGSNVTGIQGDVAKLTDLDRLYSGKSPSVVRRSSYRLGTGRQPGRHREA